MCVNLKISVDRLLLSRLSLNVAISVEISYKFSVVIFQLAKEKT